MIYNISFDIAALLMISVLAVGLNTVLYTDSPASKSYRRYTYSIIVNALMDIITAYTISYSDRVNDTLNIILNTFYQYSSAFVVFTALWCVLGYLGKTKKIHNLFNYIVGFAYIAMLTLNMFFGFIFTFKNHEYVHGPLFVMTFITAFVLVIHTIVLVIIYRKKLPKSKVLIMIFFLSSPIIFSCIQIFAGNYLLTAFGAAFATMIMLFAMETPDYKKLLKTMNDLEAAREEANAANNAKSDFLASMSHEIRTPINGVLGMDTMILKESTEANIIEYAENIYTAGSGLLAIINDILDLSKIESGKMELVPVEYELFSVLNECFQMVKMRASEKGLKFTIKNNPDIPSSFYGDEVRIRQIINNIITNAIKYTKEGSVTVNVDFEPIHETDANLIVTVTDTGIGIKDEDKEKLFSAFTRLEATKNRHIEGTGLGLKITSMLLSMMNGEISVESVYQKGSSFTVRVPQRIVNPDGMGIFEEKLKEKTHVKKNKHSTFQAKGKKLLVVDDVLVNLKVFKGLLKETGAQIDEAVSGFKAIEKSLLTKYDIIYMDHLMPEMDGIEAFHKIHDDKNNINCETPVVILTANAIIGAKEQYLKEGFTDYLSKPIEQDKLIKSLEEIL